MTFTMSSESSQLTPGSTFDLMWAYSEVNPSSSAVDASLRRHSGAGVFQFDLTAQYATTATGEASPNNTKTAGTSTSESNSDSGRSILVAHVVTGALATMLFLPLGILTPRYARGLTTNRWWFPAHSANNGIVAFALVVAAYAIGRAKFGSAQGDSPHPVRRPSMFDTRDRRGAETISLQNLGLALLVLMVAQIVLGIIAHWIKIPIRALQTSSGRGPAHYLHVGLGLVTVVIGWVTVWYGKALTVRA